MKKRNINNKSNNRLSDIFIAIVIYKVTHRLSRKIVRKRKRLLYINKDNKYNIKGLSDYPAKLNYTIYKSILEE